MVWQLLSRLKIALTVLLVGWALIPFWVTSVPVSRLSFQSPVLLHHGATMTGSAKDVIVVALAS